MAELGVGPPTSSGPWRQGSILWALEERTERAFDADGVEQPFFARGDLELWFGSGGVIYGLVRASPSEPFGTAAQAYTVTDPAGLDANAYSRG